MARADAARRASGTVTLLLVALTAACSTGAAGTAEPSATASTSFTPPPPVSPAPLPGPGDEDRDKDDGDADVAGPSTLPAWMTEPVAEAPACPATTVRVTDAAGLQAALDAARPGDVIGLADGVYTGEFVATASGEPGRPVALCGGRGAVLDAGGIKGGYALHLDHAQHWVIDGFTVRNAQKAVMADGTTGTTISRLRVHHIGDEAIHLRAASSDNLVTGNVISDTGLRKPKFGEGVYVGTAESNFCDISACEPDPSDRNRVVANAIFATTSEAVDVKEGTQGGLVARNQLDGSSLVGDADSWVDIKGRGWTIEANTGRHTPADGFQTHEIIDGWGTDNVFRDNRGELDSPEGFLVAPRPARANVVACSNTLLSDVGAVTPKRCS